MSTAGGIAPARAAAYQPRTLLVTGGAGFIGSNFVRRFLERNPAARIVDLDLLTYAGSLENLEDLPGADRHSFVRGDICDAALVDRLLREHRVDGIVHFAAESHVDRSIDGPAAFIRTNVVGTFTLLDAARRWWLDESRLDSSACRFHHISTDEVFGSLEREDPPFRETTPYAPNSPYSAAKAGADHLARAYFHTYGLPVVTTNCSNNYGPRQHPEKYLPTILRACYLGQPIPIYGDGTNVRDWLFVEDHCEALELVLRQGRLGETYNVGGAGEVANLDLARKVCTLLDALHPSGKPHERLITFVRDRPGHDRRYAIDFAKLRGELGWSPAHDLDRGLRRTLEWYLGSERWQSRVRDGTYSDTRLGLGGAAAPAPSARGARP